jgi:hypothetical protein
MAEETRTWNITDQKWEAIRTRAASNSDVLEDGAYVRAAVIDATGAAELHFYATALNKPRDWRFPFADEIPGTRHIGALVGRAWHEPATGFVHFEVVLYAAAQSVTADYESGVSDLDYVTYEQAVEQAMHGTDNDAAWLEHEFARLVGLAG